MKENRVTQLTPQEEDPVIHQYLSSLRAFTPSAGFEDRVMARVHRPAPLWLQELTNIRRALFPRRRALVWTGGLAITSTVSLAILVAIGVTYTAQLATAWSVFASGWGVEVWRATLTGAVRIAAQVVALTELATINGSTLLAAGIVIAVIVAVSSWGLYRTLQPFSSGRISLHASH